MFTVGDIDRRTKFNCRCEGKCTVEIGRINLAINRFVVSSAIDKNKLGIFVTEYGSVNSITRVSPNDVSLLNMCVLIFLKQDTNDIHYLEGAAT